MKCFVYGSLKHGLRNHGVLDKSKFVLDTHTCEKYDMVSLGGFPAVKESVKNNVIQGEVYDIDIDTLERLDHLESNGIFYHRKLIRVEDIKDDVWMYFIMNEMGSGDNKDNVHEEYGIQTWLDY